jgi:hypothetical protein
LESDKLKQKSIPPGNIFDSCLHAAGDIAGSRYCSNPKCAQPIQFKRMLLSSPDVVCIGLIWDSDRPSIDQIMDIINCIGLSIHLDKIFDRVTSDSAKTPFNLTSMITYYGRHYSTFCYHSNKRMWMYFDDARFRNVGPSWSDVIEECRKAHFQPLLLVYTNPNSTAVDTTKVSNVKLTCNGITCELLKLEMDYTSKLLQQIGS